MRQLTVHGRVKSVTGPWLGRVQETLQSLGVRSADLAQQHALPAVDVFSDAPSGTKRKYGEISEGEDGPNKRARTSEDETSAAAATNTLTQLLPASVIVSLVIDTFQRNLAPFMPTRAAQPANPNALLVRTAAINSTVLTTGSNSSTRCNHCADCRS
jgi:hypothetical protein